jgi:AraC-like DNA-binding protein
MVLAVLPRKYKKYAIMGNFVLEQFKAIGLSEHALLFPARTAPLYSMVTSAGLQRQTGTNYDWHGLKRGNSEWALLQHTVAGQGMLTFEGRSMPVLPGNSMLLHFPHDNRYWLEAGKTWEFFYLCVNGRDAVRHIRSIIARHGPLLQLDENGPALSLAIDICRKVVQKNVTSPYEASSQAYALTMALLQESLPTGSGKEAPPYIKKVVNFCRDHLREPIGVDDMAKAAKLSRFHFTRQFYESRGISPGRFLNELRLQEASRLVQDSNLPVKDIARRCGFSDANYFCKVFRKSFGVSPGAFRKSGMY